MPDSCGDEGEPPRSPDGSAAAGSSLKVSPKLIRFQKISKFGFGEADEDGELAKRFQADLTECAK